MDEFNEEDYLRSSQKASRKPLTANHLLNFNVERNLQPQNSRRNRYYAAKHVSNHSPEQFFQANFQFIVQPDFIHEQDPDQYIKWEQVKIVICHEESLQELSKCPICLDPPHAPRITKCGHIFCFTCLLRMFQSSLATQDSSKRVEIEGGVELEVDQRFKQCPLCTEMIALHLLKPVRVLIEPIDYKENSMCEFVLLRRHKNSLITQCTEDYSVCDQYTLPEYNRSYSKFCRFQKDSYQEVIQEQLNLELSDLLQLKVSADEEELRFINLAMHQLQKYLQSCESVPLEAKTQSAHMTDTESDNDDNYYYLYQEQSGQKLFLHPLSSRAILNQYGSFAFAPPRIFARIIELEEITVDAQARKRYKFMSHLPLCSVCRICELDMRPIVSRDALAPLLPKIKKRIAVRRQRKQEEERAEKKRKKAQRYNVEERVEVNLDEFESLSSLMSSTKFTQPEPQLEESKVQAPVWVNDPSFGNSHRSYIPKKLVAGPTKIRKVKGSDGESDEELAAPSFAASVYQGISFNEIPEKPEPQEEQKPKGKGRRKKQRKKQMLFSTSQLSYS